MRHALIVCVALAITFISTQLHAVEVINGQYVWRFASDQAWPNGYELTTGKPDELVYISSYPNDFFDRIANALPESELNEAFITDDAGSTIHLIEDGEVFITFLHEGAGYRNAFGYFTFDPSALPATRFDVRETIVFPNLSYPHLRQGDRVSIGHFPAGTSIGFFIAANGFSSDTGVKSSAVPYYYSLKHLNPESSENLRQHMATLYDPYVQEVVLGFEDLPRTWGDNDFNDAVFSVKTTPSSALDTADLITIPEANDSDADGIADALDEFPNNYRRAFSSYYPSNNNYVSLAFEDKWPRLGDYDMNDLVIRERLQTIYSAEGTITGFKLEGFIDARGAGFNNGFAMRIMNTTSSLFKTGSINVDGQQFTLNAEQGQTNTVLVLWDDTHDFTATDGEGDCKFFNTVKTCPEYAPVPFTLDVEFTNGINALLHSDLDFFIFRTNKRSHEIHFAGYPPTDKMDYTLFGQHADTSDPDTGRFYRSAENLAWGLKVSGTWYYPREYKDIVWCYADYETWVESSGEQAKDWFQTSNRDHLYYVPNR
ncbi:LruC domain-containing protein [Alteromonas sp. KUL42]|uniref:LruC domain-containing protein n=1 Tax=Alteromonas sp. KUL42 TaxID=2480797 RepID=UPI001036635A|nr:LruC domain-containing protein [Alteromonas sp. KUL42]TAP34033.1 LruC domain-containing protein [Alteromonas sp. KUL42]GEA08097.1 LruC domain-containing protein [Alteromonas sp. KUL42]